MSKNARSYRALSVLALLAMVLPLLAAPQAQGQANTAASDSLAAAPSAGLASVLDDPAMRSWRAELGDPVGHDLDLAATFFRSWQEVTDEPTRRPSLSAATAPPTGPSPARSWSRPPA